MSFHHKVSKTGMEKYNKNRKDPEELDNRVYNFNLCSWAYFMNNPYPSQLATELKRLDINYICKRQMDQLKDFVNKTGMNYENVYAPLTVDIQKSIVRGVNKKYEI
jgi:hypothetical protein